MQLSDALTYSAVPSWRNVAYYSNNSVGPIEVGESAMILAGWKEIAKHLRCGVRTVQRWEQRGLPVHRPLPGKRSHVIAYSDELDWFVRDHEPRNAPPPT